MCKCSTASKFYVILKLIVIIVEDRIFIIVSHDWKKIETRRLILNDEIKSEENSIPGNININIYCLNNHVVQVSVFENFKNVARFSFLSYNLIIKAVLAIESSCLQHLLLRLLRREARQ